MNKMKFSGSAVFGIILIAVGVVSLLSSMNYFDSWDIFSTYWPLIIILFGVKSLIDHRSSTLFGIVIIGVGSFLQLDELGLWYLGDIYVRELILPAMIILIGLYFILPKGNREDQGETRGTEKVSPAPKPQEAKTMNQEGPTQATTTVEQKKEEKAVQMSDGAEEVRTKVKDQATAAAEEVADEDIVIE